jgi:release factor glutamine methyltransferase
MARPRMHADSTITEALRNAAETIERETQSDEASLEAELLLCHALGIDRVQLYQRMSDQIGDAAEVLSGYLARRCVYEPTPYITGHREFFGLDFEVSPAALIPRPETETLVEAVIGFAEERFGEATFTMVDVGTGAGTIAVAVAHALANAHVIATDRSPEALAVARSNAERHNVDKRIDFRVGDLLKPLTEPVDVIAANLPYVSTADWEALPPEIREWEPRQALDGGADGRRIIERLLHAAPNFVRPKGALFAEIGDGQAGTASVLARVVFPEAAIEVADDLSGKARILICQLQ